MKIHEVLCQQLQQLCDRLGAALNFNFFKRTRTGHVIEKLFKSTDMSLFSDYNKNITNLSVNHIKLRKNLV